MRSVIFEASISLDGYIEGPNGEMDWLVGNEEGVFNSVTFFSDFDTIFFGRKAYEKLALLQFPYSLLDDEDRTFFYMLYGMRKYVFSRKMKHVEGNGMVVSGDIKEEVSRIRGETGKNILFCGGADIFRTFAALDLIDEYVLTVHPVRLRAGKALFAGNTKPLDLKLISKKDLSSGVVILHYKPANRIK